MSARLATDVAPTTAAVLALRVVVVEDEPPARRHLRALLEAEQDVTVVGECGDGASAVEMIERLRPDVVLLDIQIPELDGFGVVEAIGAASTPAVIFVTAFDEFAVRAFEIHAVDYILKPLSAARLREAIAHARAMLQRRMPQPDLAALLGTLRGNAPNQRIPVRDNGRIHLVAAAEIRFIEAEGAYLRVHVPERSWLIRETMTTMESRLAGTPLARVHRSLIVNRDRVRALEPLYRGEYVLFLADGTRLVTGRTYRRRVQEIFAL